MAKHWGELDTRGDLAQGAWEDRRIAVGSRRNEVTRDNPEDANALGAPDEAMSKESVEGAS